MLPSRDDPSPSATKASCCSGRLHLHFGDVSQVELAVPCDFAKDGVPAVPSLAVVEHDEELGVIGVGHNLVVTMLSCTGHQAPAAQVCKRDTLALIQPKLQLLLALARFSEQRPKRPELQLWLPVSCIAGRSLCQKINGCTLLSPARTLQASASRVRALPALQWNISRRLHCSTPGAERQAPTGQPRPSDLQRFHHKQEQEQCLCTDCSCCQPYSKEQQPDAQAPEAAAVQREQLLC